MSQRLRVPFYFCPSKITLMMKAILGLLLVMIMIAALAILRPKIIALILAACKSCASAALRNGLSIGGVAMSIPRWGY
jgi:hypothetical protein